VYTQVVQKKMLLRFW